MTASIPSAAEVHARLATLDRSGLRALAKASGVPVSTLIKVRYGQTKDPGVDTVAKFWPHLASFPTHPSTAAGA